MAVPLDVANATVVFNPLVRLSCTTTVAWEVEAVNSFTTRSRTETVGIGSSLTIVPTPRTRPRAAPTGLVRLTTNCSSASGRFSPRTVTVNCWTVSPGAKVRVPLLAA
jgi:hypothetical protein